MTNSQKLCISAYDELYLIDLEKVVYFQAADHYTHVYYSADSHFMLPYGLSKVQTFLAEKPEAAALMMRLGRKYVVNLGRIFRISTVKELVFLRDDVGMSIQLHVTKPILRGLISLLRNHYQMPLPVDQ